MTKNLVLESILKPKKYRYLIDNFQYAYFYLIEFRAIFHIRYGPVLPYDNFHHVEKYAFIIMSRDLRSNIWTEGWIGCCPLASGCACFILWGIDLEMTLNGTESGHSWPIWDCGVPFEPCHVRSGMFVHIFLHEMPTKKKDKNVDRAL